MNTCHSIFLRNWVSPLIRLSVLSNYMCSDMIFHLPPSHHSSETPFHFDSSSSSRQQKVRGGQRDGEGRDGSPMQYAVEVQCHHSQLQLEVHSNISLKEEYEKGELMEEKILNCFRNLDRLWRRRRRRCLFRCGFAKKYPDSTGKKRQMRLLPTNFIYMYARSKHLVSTTCTCVKEVVR